MDEYLDDETKEQLLDAFLKIKEDMKKW